MRVQKMVLKEKPGLEASIMIALLSFGGIRMFTCMRGAGQGRCHRVCCGHGSMSQNTPRTRYFHVYSLYRHAHVLAIDPGARKKSEAESGGRTEDSEREAWTEDQWQGYLK